MMNLSSNVILNNTSEEIIKSYQEQISTLCSTIAGTIPLDRDFGIDSACLSKPPDVLLPTTERSHRLLRWAITKIMRRKKMRRMRTI